jgi:hypothetical protein
MTYEEFVALDPEQAGGRFQRTLAKPPIIVRRTL